MVTGRLRRLWCAALLSVVLLCLALPARAVGEPEEATLHYAFSAKASASQGGKLLGSWPVEGDFRLAFAARDAEGRQRVDLTLDRLDAPDLPKTNQKLADLVGRRMSFVFDQAGRLVDLDVPFLPAEALQQLRERLSQANPPAGASPVPRHPFQETLRLLRPGTTASFHLAVPRVEQGAGQSDQPGQAGKGRDEVGLEIEFAGPDEPRGVYVIRTKLALDFAAAQAKAFGTSEFGLVDGFLRLADVEAALSAPAGTDRPGAPPVDVGFKLTLTLSKVERPGGSEGGEAR